MNNSPARLPASEPGFGRVLIFASFVAFAFVGAWLLMKGSDPAEPTVEAQNVPADDSRLRALELRVTELERQMAEAKVQPGEAIVVEAEPTFDDYLRRFERLPPTKQDARKAEQLQLIMRALAGNDSTVRSADCHSGLCVVELVSDQGVELSQAWQPALSHMFNRSEVRVEQEGDRQRTVIILHNGKLPG